MKCESNNHAVHAPSDREATWLVAHTRQRGCCGQEVEPHRMRIAVCDECLSWRLTPGRTAVHRRGSRPCGGRIPAADQIVRIDRINTP